MSQLCDISEYPEIYPREILSVQLAMHSMLLGPSFVCVSGLSTSCRSNSGVTYGTLVCVAMDHIALRQTVPLRIGYVT